MELCSMLCGGPDGRGVLGRMDTCICMAESLCCPPETTTILLIGYTPIQNKNLKKKVSFEPHKSTTLRAFNIIITLLSNVQFIFTFLRISHNVLFFNSLDPILSLKSCFTCVDIVSFNLKQFSETFFLYIIHFFFGKT